MQKPSLGRIVIARVAPAENNGSDEAPAVITRVWGEAPDGSWTVNVRVLVDTDQSPLSKTSVKLLDERPKVNGEDMHAAWWPPRA
jgi:subtilisin-like proprotein convertase family protein